MVHSPTETQSVMGYTQLVTLRLVMKCLTFHCQHIHSPFFPMEPCIPLQQPHSWELCRLLHGSKVSASIPLFRLNIYTTIQMIHGPLVSLYFRCIFTSVVRFLIFFCCFFTFFVKNQTQTLNNDYQNTNINLRRKINKNIILHTVQNPYE